MYADNDDLFWEVIQVRGRDRLRPPRPSRRTHPQAANYLDIQPLLELTCAKVATLIRGKTPEELRVLLKVPETEEDEEAAAPGAAEVKAEA